MSTTATSHRADQARGGVDVSPVTFPRVVRAEWLKLWSLRSTYWATGATLVVMVLMSLLMAIASSQAGDNPEFGAGPSAGMVLGFSYSMAQLVVAVLGVLAITGEYSTGMIRSSLTAVPSRVPVLAAKAIVIAVVSFVLGVLGVALAYLVTAPLLSGVGGAADLGDPAVRQIFWGTGLYLMGVALLALGIGALLRHSAGAIAAVLGLLLLASTIVQLLSMWLEEFADLYPFLPSTAGERIVGADMGELSEAAMTGMTVLDPWQGYGVLMIYVVVALGSAALLLRRRDA